MADDQGETRVSYPYMTAGQWFGVRAKLRQSLPSTVDVDWLMAALGTSEKGARNALPQLRAVGVIGSDGKPTELALDLRDDDHYANACKMILENVYPEGLRGAWDDPNEEPGKVAAWFMRNAGTGQATAMNQAKLYLTLLRAELPSPEEASRRSASKKAVPSNGAKKVAQVKASAQEDALTKLVEDDSKNDSPPATPRQQVGPNLHIDMQIHIAADASDAQIDTIFKSMAKHLYGRE